MKTCCTCRIEEAKAEFSKNKSTPDGLYKSCKECGHKYRTANREKLKQAKATYYANNKAKVVAKSGEWAAANREKSRVTKRNWNERNMIRVRGTTGTWAMNNPGKVNAKTARHRAAKKRAAPAWVNDFFVEEAYQLAALRTKLLGIEHHVDHIVPLQSKLVCGLHVENNLRAIPGRENISKGNRFWPNMP